MEEKNDRDAIMMMPEHFEEEKVPENDDELEERPVKFSSTLSRTRTILRAKDVEREGPVGEMFRATLRGKSRQLENLLTLHGRQVEERNRRPVLEKDGRGRTLLHAAAFSGSVASAAAVLEHGLDYLQARRERAIQRLRRKKRSLQAEGYRKDGKAVVEWHTESRESIERAHQFGEERAWLGLLSMQDDQGWNPVHFASQHSDPQMLRGILQGYGTNLGAKTAQGSSLYSASLKYDAATGEEIDEKCSDAVLSVQSIKKRRAALLNTVDDAGCTPLHIAAMAGNVEGVKILLRMGADASIENYDGETAMQAASNALVRRALRAPPGRVTTSHLSSTMRKSVQHGGDPADETTGLSLRSALHVAAMASDLDSIEYLLAAGATVNLRDGNGWTALHYCAHYGVESPNKQIVCMERLLENGANIDAQSNKGLSPLHVGAQTQETLSPDVLFDPKDYVLSPVIMFLVRQGAEIDLKDDEGNTALHLACRKGNARAVVTLATLGANYAETNRHGWNGLHMAFHEERSLPVMALAKLDAGERKLQTMRNLQGKAPFEMCTKPRMLKHLENIWSAAFRGDSDAVRTFAKLSDPNAVAFPWSKGSLDEPSWGNSCTPLHLAIMGCKHRVPQKADQKRLPFTTSTRKRIILRSRPATGASPLSEPCVEVVKFLLSRNVSVNAADADGRTPLSYAAERGLMATVKLLLKKGASVATIDNGGSCPLHWAYAFGHRAVVNVMLEEGAADEGEQQVAETIENNIGFTPLQTAGMKKRGTPLPPRDREHRLRQIFRIDAENKDEKRLVRTELAVTDDFPATADADPGETRKVLNEIAADNEAEETRDLLARAAEESAEDSKEAIESAVNVLQATAKNCGDKKDEASRALIAAAKEVEAEEGAI